MSHSEGLEARVKLRSYLAVNKDPLVKHYLIYRDIGYSALPQGQCRIMYDSIYYSGSEALYSHSREVEKMWILSCCQLSRLVPVSI